MAQVCDICGKGPQFGNNISHAHNVTRRRWNVNLQKVKAVVNGAPRACGYAPAASRAVKSPKPRRLRRFRNNLDSHKASSADGVFVVVEISKSGLLAHVRDSQGCVAPGQVAALGS